MMTSVLTVSDRKGLGKKETQRLRKTGVVPVNVYGKGKGNKNLTLPKTVVAELVEHRSRLWSLEGDESGTVLLGEVQWNHLGTSVLHVDLVRTDAEDLVKAKVVVVLKGEAIGAQGGGKVSQSSRLIGIECPAARIPETVTLRLEPLNVGMKLYAEDVELPEGCTLISPPRDVIAKCK
ncbi:MAG: 50S ribosomal protein L25 [Pirellulaceae bacterium]|nr:50S ribosomal protein L25 [Pirellulaceae bacterium]